MESPIQFHLNNYTVEFFVDYDPALVPIVYPGDNVDPSTLESEAQRQLEEKRRLEEEEARRKAEADARAKEKAEAEAVTEEPIIDERIGENEHDRQNEIDNERDQKPDTDISGKDSGHAKPYVPQEYLTTTTTVKPTKRRPSKHDSVCKLPTEPEPDVGYEAGYRFGTTIDSRIEFNEVPSKLKKGYDISLEFKTNHSDGVLFYAADSRHTDFIVLYLQDGYVRMQDLTKLES